MNPIIFRFHINRSLVPLLLPFSIPFFFPFLLFPVRFPTSSPTTPRTSRSGSAATIYILSVSYIYIYIFIYSLSFIHRQTDRIRLAFPYTVTWQRTDILSKVLFLERLYRVLRRVNVPRISWPTRMLETVLQICISFAVFSDASGDFGLSYQGRSLKAQPRSPISQASSSDIPTSPWPCLTLLCY